MKKTLKKPKKCVIASNKVNAYGSETSGSTSIGSTTGGFIGNPGPPPPRLVRCF